MRKGMVMLAAAAIAVVAACGGGDDDTATDTEDRATTTTAAPTATTADGAACGVTLADVQALLSPTSGVTENATPDPGRCNFTWDDGGPRGIDVAFVPGGRSSFDVPAGYEPLAGYGDEAFASFTDGRASAFAFVGDDLFAADVIADGTDASEADLRDLCLQLLDLSLD